VLHRARNFRREEDWFEDGAAGGFNIMPPLLPAQLDVFSAEVIPIGLSRCTRLMITSVRLRAACTEPGSGKSSGTSGRSGSRPQRRLQARRARRQENAGPAAGKD
jgi:hypothetical protein